MFPPPPITMPCQSRMTNTIISLIIFIQVLFFGFAPDLNRIKYSYSPLDIYSKLRRRQQHHFNDLSSKSTGSVQTSWAYIVFAWHILFKNNFKTHSNFDSPRSMTSEVHGWMDGCISDGSGSVSEAEKDPLTLDSLVKWVNNYDYCLISS